MAIIVMEPIDEGGLYQVISGNDKTSGYITKENLKAFLQKYPKSCMNASVSADNKLHVKAFEDAYMSYMKALRAHVMDTWTLLTNTVSQGLLYSKAWTYSLIACKISPKEFEKYLRMAILHCWEMECEHMDPEDITDEARDDWYDRWAPSVSSGFLINMVQQCFNRSGKQLIFNDALITPYLSK